MSKQVAIFWPGDYRTEPNQLALSQVKETTEQLQQASYKLSEILYRQADPGPSSDGASSNGYHAEGAEEHTEEAPKQDDVIDAEFKSE